MELLCVLSAFLFGLIAQLFKLPALIGYLGAGLALSSIGVRETETLRALSELGVIILLFCVGIHIRLKNLLRPEVLGTGLIHLIIFSALAWLLLEQFLGTGVVSFAIALGFSSTVVASKGFESTNSLNSFPARVALGVLILQDIVASKIIDHGSGFGWQSWLLILFPLAAYFMRIVLNFKLSPEIFLLGGISYALGVGELFHYCGLSVPVGAIFAGISLSSHSQAENIAAKLWSIKEILLIALFLSIGLYGLPDLQSASFIIFFLCLLPIKFSLFFYLFTKFRLRARSSFVAAISLSSYSEFCLVVAYFLEKKGVLSSELVQSSAVLTAISFALCSLLTARQTKLWERFGEFLLRFEKAGHTLDKMPTSLGASDVLIVGMGESGNAAYERAIELGFKPVGIDSDLERVQKRLKSEKRVIHADSQDGSFWSEVHLHRIKAVVICLPDYNSALYAVNCLKKKKFEGEIIALARDSYSEQKLRDAGVKVSVIPMIESGRELINQIPSSNPSNPSLGEIFR